MAGLAVGSEVAGYRIEAVAGEGGMGIVYAATQLKLNRRVALKVIAPDLASQANFQERFRSESRLAASIDHPNVIPVYEAGEADGLLFLVMRYVEGTDLRQLLDREGVLEPVRAARLLAQVAAALSAAHRQGLVHRDIKPANVLTVYDPQERREHAYLTDFGIAREAAAAGGLTRAGAVVGTTDYLAPERFEGNRGDARADVYAFGCMMFETLTGDIPYPRDSEVSKMMAHANSPVPSVRAARPDVPQALADVAERCMAKEPEQRYADAGELARATSAAVAKPPPPAPTVMEPAAPEEPPAELVPPPVAEPREAAPPRAQPPPAQPPPPRPTPVRPGPAPPPPEPETAELAGAKRGRWAPIVGVVALFAAVIAAAALILSAGGGGGAGEKAGPITVPGGPDGLAVVGGKVWVAGSGAGTLTPIDTDANTAGRPARVGSDPDSVTGARGSVWVTNTGDGTVSRVDATSGRVQGDPIEVGAQPEGIVASGGSIWVADAGDGGLTVLDASSGAQKAKLRLGGTPTGVAAGDGAIWVTNPRGGAVARVDTGSGRVEGGAIRVGEGPRGVAVANGSVWVANSGDGTVSRIDEQSGRPSGEPIRVGGGPREVAAAGSDGVWVTLSGAGEVVRIDAEGRVAQREKVGGRPVGIAVDDANVWVSSMGTNRVTRISR